MKKLTIIVLIIVTMVLAACSNAQPKHTDEHKDEGEEMMLGDIREETAGPEEMPEFLEGKPDDMKIVYQAVAHNAELLEKMPCYCGCGDSVGHKDNYDCFIHDNKEDGRIVWDDHGTKCIVCLEIAAKSISDYNNGKSIKDIRKEIDEQYKEGYAEPTPTKEV